MFPQTNHSGPEPLFQTMKTSLPKILLPILASLMLVSCVTAKLWEESFYDESISGFLIGQQSDEVVILGEKYHYIFSNDRLKKALLSKYRGYFKPRISDFRANGDRILGNLGLMLDPEGLSGDEIERLTRDIGFARDDDVLVFDLDLDGKRYRSNVRPDFYKQFGKAYHVRIRKDSTILHAGKILLTPVAIAVDAAGEVLLLGGFVGAWVGFCSLGALSGTSGGLCTP